MQLAALITAVFAVNVYRKRAIPGRIYIFCSLLAVSIWSFFAGVEEMLDPLAWRIMMSKIEYIGVCSVGVFWFLFVVHYVRKESFLKRLQLNWLIWIVPAIILAGAFTNEFHGLLWGTVVKGPAGNAIYGTGPLKIASIVYQYCLYLTGIWLLVRYLFRAGREMKGQIRMITASSMIPLLFNIWYLTGLTPSRTDYSPFAFAWMGVSIALSLLRYHFADIVPIACDSLFNHMDDGVLILDAKDRLIEFNPKSGKLFGLNYEMIGKDFFQTAQDFCPALSPFRELERGSYELDFDRDGRRWFNVSITPLRDKKNQSLGKLIIFRETSDRKALIHELVELNRYLEEKVRRGVQENREKDHILLAQSRQASMGEMLGNIAHQWRQPLNSLAILIQNLPGAVALGKMDEEYLKRFEDKGLMLIQYMSQTIDDFREFFKPDKAKEIFSIEESVMKAVALVEQSFKDNDILLSLELPKELKIEGYSNEFGQVLLIMLQNAKDIMQERKVQNARVKVIAVGRDGKVEVRVSDNGGGIPGEFLDRVFEPYFTTKKNGTGIGLYMSKLIIEKNMGGSLRVENVDGGACFTIEI